MSTLVHCPHCRSLQAIPPALAGQTATCPICRQPFQAPPLVGAPTPSMIAAAAPAAAEDESPTPEDAPVHRRSRFWLQWVFLFLFGGGVVAGVLVLSLVRQSRQADDEDEPGESIVEQEALAASDEERWVDATKITLRHQGIKVKVKQAHWGPVRTRDARRQVATNDEESYLTIVVGLRNKADKPRPYRSWYGSLFRVNGKQRTAELYDADGNAYPIKRFPGATAVQGHVPEATLERPGETLDAIIFAVPDGVDRSSVESLYLELPGQAFGADSLLRFEIPVSMIDGW